MRLPPRAPSAARSIHRPPDCWPEPVLPIVSVDGWVGEVCVSVVDSSLDSNEVVELDCESVVDSSLDSNDVVLDSSLEVVSLEVVSLEVDSVVDSSLLSNEVVELEVSSPAQTWLTTRLPPSMSVLALSIVVSRSPEITT